MRPIGAGEVTETCFGFVVLGCAQASPCCSADVDLDKVELKMGGWMEGAGDEEGVKMYVRWITCQAWQCCKGVRKADKGAQGRPNTVCVLETCVRPEA